MKKRILKALFLGVLILAAATMAHAGQTIKMATISPGSSAYLTMTTMATMINQAQDDINIKVDATGAATKHMIELAQGKIAPAMDAQNFATAMAAMADLRGPVDAFFEAVQVNTDSDILRRNRLNLLSSIRSTCLQVADLTRIDG